MIRRTRQAAAAATFGALLAAAGCGSIRDGAGADADVDAGTDSGEHRGMPDAGTDTGGLPGDGGGLDVVADLPADSCTIKINEVQTGGATASDEFIELYNSCPSRQVALANHRLVYRSATGTAMNEVPLFAFASEMIGANQPYFLCASSGYTGTTKDIIYANNLAAAGGAVALLGPDGNVVDAVGWGTAVNAYVETAPAPAPAAGQSIARVPDGHDTDDNLTDFMVAATPTPRAHN